MIKEQMIKNEEIINCKVRIEFRNQMPFLLREKLPFKVLIGLKFDKYKAGIIPERKAKINKNNPE